MPVFLLNPWGKRKNTFLPSVTKKLYFTQCGKREEKNNTKKEKIRAVRLSKHEKRNLAQARESSKAFSKAQRKRKNNS